MTVGARPHVAHPADERVSHLLQGRIGGQRLGGLVIRRLDPHVRADPLVGSRPPVDLVAAVAAVLADQVIALHELRRRRLRELLARLEVDHLVMALQAARLLEPLRQHREDPVVVVEPAVLVVPLVRLLGRVRSVRGPLEAGGTALPLMADGAAEVLHRVRTRVAHEQVEPRVRGIGLRNPPPHGHRERLAPGGRLEKRRHRDVSRECPSAVDRLDHVAHLKPCLRGGRAGHHHADRRIVGVEQATGSQPQPIGRLERLGLVALRLGGRRGHLHGQRLGLRVSRLERSSRHRLVHAAVARRAAVEAGDVAEVVVEGELRQPDLVDPERAVEGVEYRHLEHTLAGGRLSLRERLLELGELGAVIGDGLGGLVLGAGQPCQQRLELLAMGVGVLEDEVGRVHLGPLGVGQGEQGRLPLGRRLVRDGELVVGPVLVELSAAKLQGAGEVVLAKLGPLGNVTETGQEIAPQHQPLVRILLGGELIEVVLGEIGGLGILADRADLGQKLLRDRSIHRLPPGLRQPRLEFRTTGLIGRRLLLVDPGLGGPGLEGAKLPGVLLPGPIVVDRQQGHRGRKQRHGRHGEHHVQEFEIPPSLFGCWHWGCDFGASDGSGLGE